MLNGLDFGSLNVIGGRLSHADVRLVTHQVLVDLLYFLHVAGESVIFLAVSPRIVVCVLPGRVYALLRLLLNAFAVLSLHVIENQGIAILRWITPHFGRLPHDFLDFVKLGRLRVARKHLLLVLSLPDAAGCHSHFVSDPFILEGVGNILISSECTGGPLVRRQQITFG